MLEEWYRDPDNFDQSRLVQALEGLVEEADTDDGSGVPDLLTALNSVADQYEHPDIVTELLFAVDNLRRRANAQQTVTDDSVQSVREGVRMPE
ncbi:hypothetical protein COW94_00710 [Candidatus Peregrinibacteria bacterium CG22_combo_CG10-13_8_21_14_all_44_10]|nr:MAG: hypothetical protein AUK45_01805 [Candidatus Peregrinibacteria bacterium CG2_30_44_17]PIP66616.1 MAG: hypothetical protein COW94_00710 [Candidatus Peregrinibacteria bacterium CG22_combo_CG10-13_8_21_14_all_44_10]PIS03700.1 MAG: hypothetical protein COT83_04650 [Candidatus Peregrinibacteria bacterium CG10_big_fil_rev_8_21_14_0_10_44_7]PIX79957.1 MAG: hypothetical protein COZ35_02345 [Candidatus Peregrinibacteria bacterium CG_4_10_14_3_um_filter_44_21]PJB88319.1 MAG: hypothetical protein 